MTLEELSLFSQTNIYAIEWMKDLNKLLSFYEKKTLNRSDCPNIDFYVNDINSIELIIHKTTRMDDWFQKLIEEIGLIVNSEYRYNSQIIFNSIMERLKKENLTAIK